MNERTAAAAASKDCCSERALRPSAYRIQRGWARAAGSGLPMCSEDMHIENYLETTFMAVISMWRQKISNLNLTPGSCFLEQYYFISPWYFQKHTGKKKGCCFNLYFFFF